MGMHASPGGDGGGQARATIAERRQVRRPARRFVSFARPLSLVFAVTLSSSTPGMVRAREPWLLDLELTAGAPISSPQRDWFDPGGSLALGVSRPVGSVFALEGRLRTALFLDGDKPDTPGARDPGAGTLNAAELGFLLRIPTGGPDRRAVGPWLSASIGPALTGKDVRAVWEAGLGYGFAVGKRAALGPVLRYLQVVQPNRELEASDARLLLGGLRLWLLDGVTRPAPAPKPAPGDRDGDGLLDDRDRCVELAEDADGFEDEDGCPEADNDRDGLPDERDRCPLVAEDRDGFEDDDGCPDGDNDRDGVPDRDDQCPLEPETMNGERDDDGCPDQGLIVMNDDRVVLEERVLFDINSARIKHSGMPILRAIVKLHTQHPEWARVRIEGHADARGDTEFNQQLSERRANAVREGLIELGLDPASMLAEGFGATRLRNADYTEEAHAQNRRVEFVVIARHAGPAAAPPQQSRPTGAPVPALQEEHEP